MKKSHTTSVASAALAAALLLAACGSSDSGSADADPCDAAQKVSDAFEVGDSAESEEDAIAALDGFTDALEDFAKAAPDEIKAQAELLAEGTRALADVDPAGDPSEEVLAILASDEYDAAGEQLEDYLQETCDIEL